MTFSALLLECYRRLNFTSTPAASVTTRLSAFLNDAHRRVLTSSGMELLREGTETFSSVAGESRLNLPPNVAQVKAITDTTNHQRLRAMRLGDYRRADPGVTASGTPDYYVPVGQQQVARQPAAASGLWVVSSANDTTKKAYVEGFTSGGYQHVTAAAGTALTNGPVTRNQCGSSTDITSVTRFELDTVCVGLVKLFTSLTGSEELARIEPGRLSTSYFAIDLFPTPAVATPYRVDFARTMTDMALTDTPYLPEDFHYVLVVMACRREYAFADDKVRYEAMVFEEKEAMRAMRSFVLYPPDYRVRNDDPEEGVQDGSNLGGWFPAGRW